MQRAVFTGTGELYLEILGGSGDWSDGDITLRLADLRREGIAFVTLDDIDAHPRLSERVSRIRAAMLVNC